MPAYWVKFERRKPACAEGATFAEAAARAEQVATVVSMQILPYPAEPRLEPKSECPSFCYDPERCQGRTSCPKGHACSE